MAVLYVSEFVRLPIFQGNSIPAAEMPPLAESTVAIGAGSLQSPVFNSKTKFVGVTADAVCSINFGANPTAAATNMRLSAGGLTFFSVQTGHRLAVIQNT